MRDMVEEKPRVPLKTILQNFLNHVENLEARKRARDDAYEQEFQVTMVCFALTVECKNTEVVQNCTFCSVFEDIDKKTIIAHD